MNPLALTDHQMSMVRHAARALRPPQRDDFLQSVARHLAAQPSDSAVQAAISITLGRMPVSVFMCDSATKRGATS